MMTLLFLLAGVAMLAAMFGHDRLSYAGFAVVFTLSLYWFGHHVGQQLTIVL